MPRDPYTPRVWYSGSGGGTPYNSASMNHIEQGIDGIDVDLAAAEDAIEALRAATGAGYTRGSTFPAPAIDAPPFLYSGDKKLYLPNGDGWYDAMGNPAPATTGGTSNAPTAFTAVVATDGTTPLSWTLPTP